MLIEGPLLASHKVTIADFEPTAMIGPHALIHTIAVMRDCLSGQACNEVLGNAQLSDLPSGEQMVPEIDALRLHRWLALREPIACFAIASEAAQRTADYIIANRIPAPAVRLLQILPAALSAHLLMLAIRKHAWTFIGAGRFKPRGAWEFVIDRSDAGDTIMLPDSLFHWYAGVFERLYRRLVAPDCRCRIVASQSGSGDLRQFRLDRR